MPHTSTALQLNRLLEGFNHQQNQTNRSLNKIDAIKNDLPIRLKIFDFTQLENHGKKLAALHLENHEDRLRSVNLITELKRNKQILEKTFSFFAEELKQDTTIPPGAEWLLDNFVTIKAQVADALKFLPKEYFRKLPNVNTADLAVVPRVYHLSFDFIRHTDALLEIDTLKSFINNYQSIATLNIGEIWAIPIMLRIALIENLKRICKTIIAIEKEERKAKQILEKTFQGELSSTERLIVLAEKIKEEKSFSNLGAVYILKYLNQYAYFTELSKDNIISKWLEEKLKEQGHEASELVQDESYIQAVNQISIANTVKSLKAIEQIDWKVWFEEVSKAEQKLQTEDSLINNHNIYIESDFSTRNLCRREIEYIASYNNCSEMSLIDQVIEFSRNNQISVVETLLSDQKSIFIEQYQLKEPFRQKLQKVLKQKALSVYLSSLFICTAAVTFSVYLMIPTAPLVALLILAPLTLVLSLEYSHQILQWILTSFVRPQALPRLDCEQELSAELKTAVVVNTIIKDTTAISQAINELEVRFLANQDHNLIFGLLADYPEGPSETEENDEAVYKYMQSEISNLNKKYKFDQKDDVKFFALFRNRVFSESEGKYLGWERKRGKLHEFNQLVLNQTWGTFVKIPQLLNTLKGIKYILTLDSDTILPLQTARKMLATIAHPLNKPVLNDTGDRIAKGYAVVQPLNLVTLESANCSLFSRLTSVNKGIDPYSSLVSEVYHDIFDEGTYVGKGIYDVQVFEQLFSKLVPENSILSHDLFEGNLLRCALSSDIHIYENIPYRFSVELSRQHRWLRGDWQLLPWLGKLVDNRKREKIRTPFHLLGRWKMLDNLRRSITPPVLLSTIFLGFILNTTPLLIFSLLTLALPVANSFVELFCKIKLNRQVNASLKQWAENLAKNILIFLFNVITLPVKVMNNLDAIFRTLYRLYVSKVKLLEWLTAESAEQTFGNTIKSYLILCWPNYLCAMLLAAILLTLTSNTTCIILAVLLIFLWSIAPLASWRVSQLDTNKTVLSKDNTILIYETAWRTWQYYKNHLIEDFNFLVPDNVQMVPKPTIATRTSPTNIGFSLIAVNSAQDLGFINIEESVNLTSAVIHQIKNLEKFSGQLFNWYSCENAAPLRPRYISYVDSSNFLAYAVVTRQALKELFTAPCWKSNFKYCKTKVKIIKDPNTLTFKYIQEQFTRSEDRHLFESLCPWYAQMQTISETSDLSTDELNLITDLQRIISKQTPSLALCKKINMQLIEAFELNQNQELLTLYGQARAANKFIESISEKIRSTIYDIKQISAEMDFSFLYDQKKNLFSIGYNIDQAALDDSYYDLLASEARIGSLVNIAYQHVPAKHWFHLGRKITKARGGKALYSWSGTAFEYLLPNLFTKNYEHSLITESNRAAIRSQILYTLETDIPWGISESAYSATDFQGTYQYRAFGLPKLGMKRGLARELVISPYSSFMALELSPKETIRNIRRLKKIGAYGKYGFYEALDYTPERLKKGEDFHIVKTFFAHHQGMILASINNFLNDGILQKRFHSDPRIRAVELLLHEKFPVANIDLLGIPESDQISFREDSKEENNPSRYYSSPFTEYPHCHILSNSKFSTLVTNAGAGKTFYNGEINLNTWQEGVTKQEQGIFVYIKDLKSKAIWSNAYLPCKSEPDSYDVFFNPDKIEFKRKDSNIITHTEITISNEHNLEIRRVSLTNLSEQKKEFQITSFADVALFSERAFNSHPAFFRTFIEADFIEDLDGVILRRKPRKKNEQEIFLFHQLSLPVCWSKTTFECDRLKFMGRYHDHEMPAALQEDELSNSDGSVLDPCVALRTKLEASPGFSAHLSFITGIAFSREEAINMMRLHHNENAISRTFDLSTSKSNIIIRSERFTISQIHRYQYLANAIFYNIPEHHNRDAVLNNNYTQEALWRFGISGDWPILLLVVDHVEQIKLVKDMIVAHEYLRHQGVSCDLVILNCAEGGYLREFYQEIEAAILYSPSGFLYQQNKGIFLREINQLSPEEINLLQAISRITIYGSKGSLKDQLDLQPRYYYPGLIDKTKQDPQTIVEEPGQTPDESLIQNQFGNFTKNGKAYRLLVHEDLYPPLPWSNVIANEDFGCLISESGSGFTWSANSRENRISPWSNDPILDPVSEAIYLHDSENNYYTSLTPQPAGDTNSYQVEHGFGYSTFAHKHVSYAAELTISVDPVLPVKIFSINLTNLTDQLLSFDMFMFVDLSLGFIQANNYRHFQAAYDHDYESLQFENRYNNEFNRQIALFGSSNPLVSFSTNRHEFIGQYADLKNPVFLTGNNSRFDNLVHINQIQTSSPELSGDLNCSPAPAAILQISCKIPAGQSIAPFFYIAQAQNKDNLSELLSAIEKQKVDPQIIQQAKSHWQKTTEKIQISTPEKTFDTLLNGWLTYQNQSCRIHGRSAFYQSGGAIGFRDQLQDSMACLYTNPELTRAQILLHAEHQFPEGDVQHWWHPPTGKGVRTRISDDLLWLPYVTAEYIKVTGDRSILREQVPFITGPQLKEDQHDLYFVPEKSDQSASLLDHCCRAIAHAYQLGVHDLPLIKGGDWNDGMDEVGHENKGESVWLAWFLADILNKFTQFFDPAQQQDLIKDYQSKAKRLVQGIETHAWDGDWYLRAFYDDGTPLGSHKSMECQIDSLAQSWSIITGLGQQERQKTAMSNVYKHLVDEELRIIKLLTPAFDQTDKSPGYIKGYLPGVRENGAQYTHAASWVILATAKMGEQDQAFKLFQLINPVDITASNEGAERYMGEPYVTCGDVLSNASHPGRAGWSWYTGSGGWLYRIGIEEIIGLKKYPDGIEIKPCVPSDWSEFSISISFKQHFQIKVYPNSGQRKIILNDKTYHQDRILFTDAQDFNSVEVWTE